MQFEFFHIDLTAKDNVKIFSKLLFLQNYFHL